MHGGDIYRNKIHTDFSVNVNPLGIPENVREVMAEALENVQAYPDLRCEKLRSKLAERHGLRPENVLCGNGASELIYAICRMKKPRRALLLAPGFTGYQRALQAQECRITHLYLRKDEGFAITEERASEIRDKIKTREYDLFFLANPSNPVGRLTSREILCSLAKACEETNTTMVVDECFMELTEKPGEYTMTGLLSEYPHLCVLRAFTKTFAIPGIRLGYLLCKEEETCRKIAAQLPEWNVSIPAQMAGLAALEQDGYLEASRRFIKGQRKYLEGELQRLGAVTFPSDANFILFHWKKEQLYESLLGQGFLIRDCRDYLGLGRGYYRIAVKNLMENQELIRRLDKE